MKQGFACISLGILIAIGVSCGSSKPQSQQTGNVRLLLKAQPGDEVVAFALGEDLLDPGAEVARVSYEESTSLADLQISGDKSYRIRLQRSGLQYLETIVLVDQFALADNDILDVGELSGATTLLSLSAFKTASLSPVHTTESALKAALEEIKANSNIQVLSDVKKANITDPAFALWQIHQINLCIITVARTSATLTNKAYVQSNWNQIMSLIADIAVHRQIKGSNSDAKALADRYVSLVNTGTTALDIITDNRIENQFVDNTGTTRSAFLNLAQSGNATDSYSLFGLLFETQL